MEFHNKIFVAGHKGMVGAALVKALGKAGFKNIVKRSSFELDLRNQAAVAEFFEQEKPEYVFLAAAKVGGILANDTFRADFLLENLSIQNNVIYQSYQNAVKKLMFLGSSCIYPKLAPQPLKEAYLLTGLLEKTNEPYAIAKIAGIKLCEAFHDQYNCNFISVMPTNLYGYNDNYHPTNSHVMPALIRRFHEAKLAGLESVVVWGSGSPLREFMFADDLADACLHLMLTYNKREFINIGTGVEITIKDLALLIARITGYEGNVVFDITKPDGTPRKLMDVSKLREAGYTATTTLEDGLKLAYHDFLTNDKYRS